MAKFQLSEIFIVGVEGILTCSNDSFIELLNVLRKIGVGIHPQQLIQEIDVIDELKDKSAEVTNAVFSIADFSALKKIEDDEIVSGLLEALKDSDTTVAASGTSFNDRIYDLLNASVKIKQSVRIFDLSTKGKSIYRSSVIVSDIRVAFEDDLKSDNKRSGVVIHNLSLRYSKDEIDKNSQLDLALDMRDLIDLKKQIDRAIEKEQIIISSYSDNIEFIELS